MVIFIVGAWTSQTIVYVPGFVNRRDAVPFVLTFEIAPRCGPLEMRTLCGSPPVQTNLTVVPRLMLSFFGPKLICGPTFTDFVAANAGMAITAAATAPTATSRAMRVTAKSSPRKACRRLSGRRTWRVFIRENDRALLLR